MAGREKDYYDILGVARDSKLEDIKKAYRSLAKKYHPDLHPNDKAAEAKFKEINEAFAVLSDAEKRKTYDLGGRVTFEGVPPWEAGPGGFDFSNFENYFGGGFEDIFSDLFGGRGAGRGAGPRRGQRGPMRGSDLEYTTRLSFMQAVNGAELELTVKRGGASEKVKARIPHGVRDGSRVRVPGKGGVGSAGGSSGDLYINVTVEPHAYFDRQGEDIYIEVPVTIKEATLGADIAVPTVDGGHTTVRIPAGTQSGKKLRIKAKGVKTAHGAGDAYIVIKVMVPPTVDDKTKELLEELEKINPYEPRKGLW
ncbi:MAG: DnaJ domain-containing protein [Deltaproteobacteria bacterium]|nr:DnaJ domain-containing protein [Deltaproteobacteria bacterium]